MAAEFKSWRSFWRFEREVAREQRFVRTEENEEFLATIAETSHSRKVDLKPLPNRASDGRVNPKGIPCLYLASTKVTALSEVRPWIGSYVSVAQFKVLHALSLVDCSRNHNKTPIFLDEPGPAEREKAVWSHVARAFSTPTTRSDDIADYVSTQILAEIFRREGFGGVAYKSNFDEAGFNIAIFDINAADLINCGLFRVDGVKLDFTEADNPYFLREHHDKDSLS